MSSAVDVILRTFPKLTKAQIILHTGGPGREIYGRSKVVFLARIFRKLERHLPGRTRLLVSGLQDHPALARAWRRRSGPYKSRTRNKVRGIARSAKAASISTARKLEALAERIGIEKGLVSTTS